MQRPFRWVKVLSAMRARLALLSTPRPRVLWTLFPIASNPLPHQPGHAGAHRVLQDPPVLSIGCSCWVVSSHGLTELQLDGQQVPSYQA